MAIGTYEDSGNGKHTKVFFVVESGEVVSVKAGNQVVPVEQGYQFYVDEHVALQIDKCELYMDGITPRLRLKSGEELDVLIKTEKEMEIERLKRELNQLENAE